MPGGLLRIMAGQRSASAQTGTFLLSSISPGLIEHPAGDVPDRVPIERLVQGLRSETDVRSRQYVWKPAKRMTRRQGLVLEGIDRKASDPLAFERLDQSSLFDQRSARGIDQIGRGLHHCELSLPHDSASLPAEHQMDGQEVRLSKQVGLRHQPCA